MIHNHYYFVIVIQLLIYVKVFHYTLFLKYYVSINHNIYIIALINVII